MNNRHKDEDVLTELVNPKKISENIIWGMDRNNLKYRQSTLAVVTNKDGKYLVVNKMVYAPDKYWSFPGGGVDEGETPEQALLRELAEELGLTKVEISAKSKNAYVYEWTDEVIEKTFREKGKLFRGQQLTQFWVKFSGEDNQVIVGDGIRAIKWISKEELKDHLLFPDQLTNAEKIIEEFGC